MELKEKILKAPSPARVIIEGKEIYSQSDFFRENVNEIVREYFEKETNELAKRQLEDRFFYNLSSFYLSGSNFNEFNMDLINLYAITKIYKQI